MESRTKVAVALLVALAAVAAWRFRSAPAPRIATVPSATLPTTTPVMSAAASASASASAAVVALPIANDAATLGPALLRVRWGSAFEELGRSHPQEGNPEAPMSIALAGKDVVILDQVNTRVVRYDERGRRVAGHDTTNTTQDVAVAADGTMALLDRLVDRKVTLVGADGKTIGELPLSDGKTGDPGLVTGLFVDGKDVYVEKEHGALVRIGTTDGKTDQEPKTLSGRPSKDGVLLLTAALSNEQEGRVVLNAFDRKKGALRFARQLSFPRPAHAIVLLDTDGKGTILVGVASGTPTSAHVFCMDPADGRLTGQAILPLSDTAEESFRDFAVRPDGTIVFVLRTDEGIEVRTGQCTPIL